MLRGLYGMTRMHPTPYVRQALYPLWHMLSLWSRMVSIFFPPTTQIVRKRSEKPIAWVLHISVREPSQQESLLMIPENLALNIFSCDPPAFLAQPELFSRNQRHNARILSRRLHLQRMWTWTPGDSSDRTLELSFSPVKWGEDPPGPEVFWQMIQTINNFDLRVFASSHSVNSSTWNYFSFRQVWQDVTEGALGEMHTWGSSSWLSCASTLSFWVLHLEKVTSITVRGTQVVDLSEEWLVLARILTLRAFLPFRMPLMYPLLCGTNKLQMIFKQEETLPLLLTNCFESFLEMTWGLQHVLQESLENKHWSDWRHCPPSY